MNRTLEHVFQFVVAELGTEGSIDGNNRLVLRGKYVPKGIESLLRKYIGTPLLSPTTHLPIDCSCPPLPNTSPMTQPPTHPPTLYPGEYVACTTCKSPNTTLSRDSVSRLYFVHCQTCGSSRSVAPIKSGYHAQTRADRRALRK